MRDVFQNLMKILPAEILLLTLLLATTVSSTHVGHRASLSDWEVRSKAAKQRHVKKKRWKGMKKGNESSSSRKTPAIVNATSRKTPAIVNVHIHKSGGTLLCSLAKRNHLRVPDKRSGDGVNCNLRGDGPKHWSSNRHGYKSCANFVQIHSKLKFSAVERYLFLSREICVSQRIKYMTCVRDPIARIESAMNFHRIKPASIRRWATVNTVGKQSPMEIGSPTVDNFMVRSFAGDKAYLKHLGAMNEADLAKAKDTLSGFAVVLVLENFDSRDSIQLSCYFGWDIMPLGGRAANEHGGHATPIGSTIIEGTTNRSSSNISSSSGSSILASLLPSNHSTGLLKGAPIRGSNELDDRLEGLLRKINHLDYAFYRHADVKAADLSAQCRSTQQRT